MSKKINFYKWGSFFGDSEQYKYIRSLCHQLGWTKPHEKYKSIPDNERLGRFVAENCQHKKPISQQTPKELSTTIFQLEQVLIK
ncbi:conserved hypothetical protein [Tenacibaculum sp. 190524A02b]|uniref:Uncharacterized protein n=1 Tax=Tenacibaculum vairaonense TaxID=3137860 RepID=A0ABM9PQY6_9FLAO